MDEGAEGEAVIPARGEVGHRNLNRIIQVILGIVFEISLQGSP